MRENERRVMRSLGFPIAGLCLAGALMIGGNVLAEQAPNASATQEISRRLDAAEIQARALREHLVANQRGMVQVAGLFGPDEEEQQHEQGQDSSIQQLNQRVGDVEGSLRNLTGQMERLQHRIDEMNTRMQRMQQDFDYKLCSVTNQQLNANTGGEAAALPCSGNQSNQQGSNDNSGADYASGGASNGASLPSPPSSPGNAQDGPVHLAPPPGVLGSLSQNEAASAPRQTAMIAPPDAATGPSNAQFNTAMDMLAKGQYDQARAAFRAFADANPKDPLAPQAVYWVGDIAYVQKDYPNAARAFAEEIKKYPASARGPESMLRLGQSLIAMNQKQEGCTALGALPGRYPNASKNVLGLAAAARKTSGCH